MKARIARYVILGLISFLIGLVTFLPAQVAAGWVDAYTSIRLGGVTGTVLSGQADYAAGPGATVENLSWTLHPLDLLAARASADVHVDSDLDGFSATLTRSLFGRNRIENLIGSASAGWLAKLGGYTFLPLSGRLSIDIDAAAFTDNLKVSALKGRLRMSKTRWELVNPPLKLGRFSVVLSHGDQGIKAAIADSQGPLAIDGGINVTTARRFDLDVRLRARAGADKRLKALLEQLGRVDSQGWHNVRERGRL